MNRRAVRLISGNASVDVRKVSRALALQIFGRFEDSTLARAVFTVAEIRDAIEVGLIRGAPPRGERNSVAR